MLINFHTHKVKKEGIEVLNFDSEIDVKSNFYSYGIHPKDIEIETFNEEILKSKNCIAIGEIGLDKLISIPVEKQLETFKAQVLISEKNELPVIIHCVKAWNEILLVKKELAPKQKWIFHGFSKTNLISEVLRHDILIGIGTRLLFDEKLQNCLKEIPIQKILLETDSDEKNSILSVYQKVAELKNISLQELESQIEKNFNEIFTKWQNG